MDANTTLYKKHFLISSRACALIGILFVLSSFLLAGKSIWALAKVEHTGHVSTYMLSKNDSDVMFVYLAIKDL